MSQTEGSPLSEVKERLLIGLKQISMNCLKFCLMIIQEFYVATEPLAVNLYVTTTNLKI